MLNELFACLNNVDIYFITGMRMASDKIGKHYVRLYHITQYDTWRRRHAICGVNEKDLVANEIETQSSEEQRAANVREVKNREAHNNLRSDLVEHISCIRLPNNDDD